MANFINNLASQLNNAFNSPVGLKIGKHTKLFIDYHPPPSSASTHWFSPLRLRRFSIFLLENFTTKRNNKLRGSVRYKWNVSSFDNSFQWQTRAPKLFALSLHIFLTVRILVIKLATHDAPQTKKTFLCNLISCNNLKLCNNESAYQPDLLCVSVILLDLLVLPFESSPHRIAASLSHLINKKYSLIMNRTGDGSELGRRGLGSEHGNLRHD